MSNAQLRANVRNLLVGATLQEMWDVRVGQLARGDTEGASYTDEYVREVRADFDESFSRFDDVDDADSTLGTEILDHIEATDWNDWSVRQFYAECRNCADIHRAATIAGPDDITVHAPENDLSRRADRISEDLSVACAVKHGFSALAEYAIQG